MNTKSAGLTLVECMIYCAALAWMATLVGCLLFNYVTSLNGLTERCKATADLHCAYDAIARDVARASCQKASWYVMQNDQIIFQMGPVTVGWLMQDNKLMRFEGGYDQVRHSWRTYGRSLALDKVTQVVFRPYLVGNNVTSVTVSLIAVCGKCHMTVEGIAYVYNGELL